MPENSGDYLVGIATTDVTPPVGTPMCGYAFRGVHATTGVYHRLRAVAVVVDDGLTPVLLVSVEWLGCYDKAPAIRRRLSAATGIPEPQIVVTGTHTHCGPAIRESDVAQHGEIDREYLVRATEAIAEAAAQAWHQRFPARLRRGVGRFDLAVCRRRPDPDQQIGRAHV